MSEKGTALCVSIFVAHSSTLRRATGIDEKVMTTSLRSAARAAVMYSAICAGSVESGSGGGADASFFGGRRKMKSVSFTRSGQSDGRANVLGIIGMTIGMFWPRSVFHVSARLSPKSLRSRGRLYAEKGFDSANDFIRPSISCEVNCSENRPDTFSLSESFSR